MAIDDRASNKHARTEGGLAVASLAELLIIMRSTGVIDAESYYATLRRLREAGVCFIPVSSDEVLTAILPCHIDGSGAVIESAALSALHTYLRVTFESTEYADVRGVLVAGAERYFFDTCIAALGEAERRLYRYRDLAVVPKGRWLRELRQYCSSRLSSAIRP